MSAGGRVMWQCSGGRGCVVAERCGWFSVQDVCLLHYWKQLEKILLVWPY